MRLPPQLQIHPLCGRLVRHMLRRPYLAVRMRIAGAHHRAAVFKNLHMLDEGLSGKLSVLRSPRLHHGLDLRNGHARKRQAVVRMEAEHTAYPALLLCTQQPRSGRGRHRRIRQQSGIVVIECEYRCVIGIPVPPSAFIPGAEIAFRVVMERSGSFRLPRLSLPRTLCPVRRDEHPVATQRVVAAVRERIALRCHDETGSGYVNRRQDCNRLQPGSQ